MASKKYQPFENRTIHQSNSFGPFKKFKNVWCSSPHCIHVMCEMTHLNIVLFFIDIDVDVEFVVIVIINVVGGQHPETMANANWKVVSYLAQLINCAA